MINSKPLELEQSNDLIKKHEGNPIVTFNQDGSARSYLKDLFWDFVSDIKNGKGKVSILSFAHISEVHRYNIQHTLYLIQYKRNLAVGTLEHTRASLQTIVECLGSSDFTLLDKDYHYRMFSENLKAKNFSDKTIQKIFGVLNNLHDIGIIERLINGLSFRTIHASLTKKTEQHIAIPEQLASTLFGNAIAQIEKYHPYRHEINDVCEKVITTEHLLKNKCTSTKYKAIKAIKHNIPDFTPQKSFSDVNKIQLCCYLVVLGFSGVRQGEAVSFNSESYSETIMNDGINLSLLKGEITKNNISGVARPEVWVTHPIVKLALELASDMIKYARNYYLEKISHFDIDSRESALFDLKSAFLVTGVYLQRRHFISKGFNQGLTRLIKKWKLKAVEADVKEFDLINPTRKGQLKIGGYLPKLSAHDFRRTFAVFVVRNKLGNVMTIKHQYKHDNINMSQWYANGSSFAAAMDFSVDQELMQMVKESNEEISVEIYDSIFNQEEVLTGKEGERIINDRNNYKGSIYRSKDEIRRQIKNGSLSVVEHPTGYCVNPSCDRICASNKSAVTCQFEIITLDKAKSRMDVRKRLIERFIKLNNGSNYMASILSNIYVEIKAIEITLAKHNLPFDPFLSTIQSNTMKSLSLEVQ